MFSLLILGFNIKSCSNAQTKIIIDNVIYKVIEDFEDWRDKESKKIEEKALKDLKRPFKIQILQGYIFRQSNPAVVGVEILAGIVRSGVPLMKEGIFLCELKTIQKDGENIKEVNKGDCVAIALPGVMVGRQINEFDILYSDLKETDFIKLKKLKKYLNREEIEILKEIAEIKRKQEPMWGV